MNKLVLAVGLVLLGGGIAQAAPVDLLPNDPNLAIFLKEFPPEVDTKIFLDAATNVSPFAGQVGSQTGQPTVNFTAHGNVDVANGFATVKPHADTTLTSMDITIPGHTFGDLLFDEQLLKTQSGDLNLTIEAFSGLTLLGSLTLDKNTLQHDADQSFKILAEGGNTITDVLLTSTTGFKELKHFQVSDLSNPSPVPAPTALPLFLTGLAGIGGLMWRRKRRS